MAKTISIHNGASWSRGHNVRDEKYVSEQKHIDRSLSANNVVIRDVPVRKAYEDIFGKAVKEYNAKQTRADRKIDSYYDKIKKDKRKNPVYECIVQIGDCSDTGNTAVSEKQALIKFAENWEQRNPNLKLIGAYVHADEPNGTVHLHIDYIPVAECTRGMRIQNSLDRALQQQGFKTENIHNTAQISWQNSEREALTSICTEMGINAQHSQNIGKGRSYLTPQEYRLAKDKQKTQIEEELQPLKDELDDYKNLKIGTATVDMQGKKIPFSGRTVVQTEELEKLKKQAKAYTANRSEIKSLREDRKEYERDNIRLKAQFADLRKREEQVQQREAQICQRESNVQRIYNRQMNLNQITEQRERQIVELRGENGTLQRLNDEQGKIILQLQKTLRGAYESLTNIVKAVGMLKYDKKDGYKAELTAQQARLIDAISDYGAYWAKTDGFEDLAEDIKTHIGISSGIKERVNELTPKRTRGRGGPSL